MLGSEISVSMAQAALAAKRLALTNQKKRNRVLFLCFYRCRGSCCLGGDHWKFRNRIARNYSFSCYRGALRQPDPLAFVSSNLSAQSGKSVPQLFMGDWGRTVGAADEIDAEDRPHAYGLPCISSLPLRFALSLFLFAAVPAGNVLVYQERVILSVGLFVSVATAFLSLYWAYFEFEYPARLNYFLEN